MYKPIFKTVLLYSEDRKVIENLSEKELKDFMFHN